MMNAFQQVCPSCQSTLELPKEADGKEAICPACQTQFKATAMLPVSTTGDHAAPDVPPAVFEPVDDVSIESVLGDTRCVFANRRRPLLVPFLVPSVLILLGLVFPIVYLSDLAVTNRARAWVGITIGSPWFLVVLTYAMWFALNLAIEVCDAGPQEPAQQRPAIRSWFIPAPQRFISMLIALTGFALIAALLVGATAAIINIANSVGAIEIRLLLGLGSFFGALMLAAFVATRLWPILPLIMEGRTGIQAIQESLAISGHNLVTSFLLVTAVFFLNGCGFVVLGLGLPLAIPLSALLLVIGMRRMTGRPIPAFESDEHWRG